MHRFIRVCRFVLYLAVVLWTAAQSVLGLSQLLGISSSNNPLYAITGSFNNPGPYGGFVAIGIAVVTAWLVKRHPIKWKDYSLIEKLITGLSLITLVLGILVLPSTFSRAAWLALAVSMIVLSANEFNALEFLGQRRSLLVFMIIIVVALSVGAFLLKPGSALGRLHIWRIECLSIAEKPLCGHGAGSALVSYGETQAEFFKKKERNELTIGLAGCPEYAFNEYLKVGVEYGVPVMLGFIAVVFFSIRSLLRRRSPFGYGLIVLSVFAFFPYPFSLWQFRAIGLILIATAVPGYGRWRYLNLLTMCVAITASIVIMVTKPKPKESIPRQLFAKGYVLHQEGKYEESNSILKEGADLSSDPMFHNIIGKNLEAMGDYESAESEYLHAHYMVPCRLYPLILLMEMKVRRGNTAEAINYGNMAISLPVNKKNPNMMELHDRARICVDSLRLNSTLNHLLP